MGASLSYCGAELASLAGIEARARARGMVRNWRRVNGCVSWGPVCGLRYEDAEAAIIWLRPVRLQPVRRGRNGGTNDVCGELVIDDM